MTKCEYIYISYFSNLFSYFSDYLHINQSGENSYLFYGMTKATNLLMLHAALDFSNKLILYSTTHKSAYNTNHISLYQHSVGNLHLWMVPIHPIIII